MLALNFRLTDFLFCDFLCKFFSALLFHISSFHSQLISIFLRSTYVSCWFQTFELPYFCHHIEKQHTNEQERWQEKQTFVFSIFSESVALEAFFSLYFHYYYCLLYKCSNQNHTQPLTLHVHIQPVPYVLQHPKKYFFPDAFPILLKMWSR